jgi:hypothetical protein
MGLRVDELTVDHAVSVLSEFGVNVPVDDELLKAGMALLQGQNINTVADMIQKPDSVLKLVEFMGRGANLIKHTPDDFNVVAVQPQQLTIDSPVGLISANPGWRMPGEMAH